MYFSRVIDSHQQAVLTEALNEHCRQHGICASATESCHTAQRIMVLFDSGMRRAADFKFLLANS